MRQSQALGIVSIVALAWALVSLAYLHIVPTGLSPVRNAVSQYGIFAHKGGYRSATIAMGVAGAALAAALGRVLHGAGVAEVLALLAAFASCRIAISWAPMDAPGAASTPKGAAHGVLAIVTFVSVSLAAIRLCRVLEAGVPLHSLAALSRVLGWAMVVCIALMFFARLSPELRRVFGAVERALYIAVLGWLGVFAMACATAHP